MKMIVCWASATFSFIRASLFACWRDTQLLIRGEVCCISAVINLIISCHIAYKTLSHLYYFHILGGVKLAYMVSFNNQMHLHLSSFVWNAAQTTSWSGLSDQIYFRLECAAEGIYTWSFHDQIAIRSEKTHEVTRCKLPLYVGGVSWLTSVFIVFY